LILGTLPQTLMMINPLQTLTDVIPMEFIVVIVVIAIILIVVGIFASSYTVVPPHEAHVVVQGGRGRKLYSSRPDSKGRVNSKYFAMPIVQRRARLPLRNKQLYIVDIPLRDKDLAKFKCDVTCWINIEDPVLASERIGEQHRIRDFTGIEDDIKKLSSSCFEELFDENGLG